jgi:hypothetical protein
VVRDAEEVPGLLDAWGISQARRLALQEVSPRDEVGRLLMMRRSQLCGAPLWNQNERLRKLLMPPENGRARSEVDSA